jgi:hypothetical protein
MAETLLTWRHSGFSVDASIPIPASDPKKRQAIAQYIARPPISLAKIPFKDCHGKSAFHTEYHPYFKENLKLFPPLDFIAERTQHIPPLGMQYIRRYGIYSSRGRGLLNQRAASSASTTTARTSVPAGMATQRSSLPATSRAR